MNTSETSTVTLRSLDGEPLVDNTVRETVMATARAIAERIGVAIVKISATDSSVTATLRAGRIEAIGFAAELRRLTNAWYMKKFNEATLWGDAPRSGDGDDGSEAWKRA